MVVSSTKRKKNSFVKVVENRVDVSVHLSIRYLVFLIIVGQGPTVLAVGADGVVLTFFLSSVISLFFLPLSGRRPDID